MSGNFFIEHQQVQVWDGDSSTNTCWSSQVLPPAAPRATPSALLMGNVSTLQDEACPRLAEAPNPTCLLSHLLPTWVPRLLLTQREKNPVTTPGQQPGSPIGEEMSPLLSSLLHLTGALVWVQLFHVLTETHSCWTQGWFSFLCWSWTWY